MMTEAEQKKAGEQQVSPVAKVAPARQEMEPPVQQTRLASMAVDKAQDNFDQETVIIIERCYQYTITTGGGGDMIHTYNPSKPHLA